MHNNETIKMLEHFKKEWVRDDIVIALPKGYKYSKQWDSISRNNIQVLSQKHHPKSVEWTIIVHDVFKFGVVKNDKAGYHIQQLQYTPEEPMF